MRPILTVLINCLILMSIHAQTLANTNDEINKYPITDIRDGAGLGGVFDFYTRALYDSVHGFVIPEMSPASQDPAGNWGKPADGLQLSLRFHNYEFMRKEPVMAIIILRNLDLASRTFDIYDEHDFQFSLHYGTNTIVLTNSQNQTYGTPLGFNLEASAEVLQTACLNRFFKLNQTGKYTLQVQALVPKSDGKGETNVISGTAAFEIVEQLSPSAINERKAQAEALHAVRNKAATNGMINVTQ